MLSPSANADMDNVCVINLDDGLDILQDDGVMAKMIDSKGCERNNILLLELTDPNSGLLDASIFLQYASALWCRHDRNERVENSALRCVLYDTKPRKWLR